MPTAPSRTTRSKPRRTSFDRQSASGPAGGVASPCGAPLPDPAPPRTRLGDRNGGHLGIAGHRARPARPGAGDGNHPLSVGRLGGALGDRIPDRHRQRLRPGPGNDHRLGGHALCPRQRRGRNSRAAHLFVLLPLPAQHRRTSRHRHYRRRLQPVRVPGNLVVVVLRADQPRPGPPGLDRRLPVPGHGHHRRHLLHHRRRHDVHDDRHPQHGRSGDHHPGRRRYPHHHGGAGLPDRRHKPEAGAFPAPYVAAQCLYLCAVGGHRIPGGDGYQGRGLCLDPHPFHGLRRGRCFRHRRRPGNPHRSCRHGHGRGFGGGHLPDRHQAHAGLFLGGTDRLHGPRHLPRLGYRPDGRHRASVQPRADESRALHGHGLHLHAHRIDVHLRHGRNCQAHAADHGGVCRRRIKPYRRAVDGRLRFQVVSDSGGAGKRLVAVGGCHPGEFAIRHHLCVAGGRGRLFPAAAERGPGRYRSAAHDAGAARGHDRGDLLFRH